MFDPSTFDWSTAQPLQSSYNPSELGMGMNIPGIQEQQSGGGFDLAKLLGQIQGLEQLGGTPGGNPLQMLGGMGGDKGQGGGQGGGSGQVLASTPVPFQHANIYPYMMRGGQ